MTARAGDRTADATFAGGLLVSGAEAWDALDAYAAALAHRGQTRPADEPNFKPQLTLDQSADAVLAAAVAQNAYEGARIQNADGSIVHDATGAESRVVAAGTVEGQVRFVLTDGTVTALSDGQSILIVFADPTDEQLALDQPPADEAGEATPDDAGDVEETDAEKTEEPANDGEAEDAVTEGEAEADQGDAADSDETASEEATEDAQSDPTVVSSLAQLLAEDTSSDSLTVTVRAGDAEQDVFFAGGLLVSEGAAWDALPTFAQARSAEGTERPQADPAFVPEISLGLLPNGTIASAVNDGVYRGAYIEDVDGNRTQIVAVRTYREGGAEQIRAVDAADSFVDVEDGSRVVLEFAAPQTTGGFFGIGAVNALADLLSRATEQGDASLSVTVDNGSDRAQATFAGGLLVSEQAARDGVPGYAEASTNDATDALAFTPDLILADGADAGLAASVAAGAYTGAYVNGEQIVAAANVDGKVLYATADGALHELADGETITVTYAAPATNDAPRTRAARSVQTMAVLQNEATGIMPNDKIIYKQWQDSLQSNVMGFQGGTIDSSTVPHYGDGNKDYWPHKSSDMSPVDFSADESFRGAYVLIGASQSGNNAPTGGSRYAIDWLGVIDGEIYYRLTSTAATAQNNPVVLASKLDKNSKKQFVIFHYDNSGARIFNINISTSKGTAVSNSTYKLPELLQIPTTIGTDSKNNTITIRARRDAGTKLYIENINDIGKYFDVLVRDTTTVAGPEGENGYIGYSDSSNPGSLEVYWKLRLKDVNIPASVTTLTIPIIARSSGDNVSASISLNTLDTDAIDTNQKNKGFKVGAWSATRPNNNTELAYRRESSHINFDATQVYTHNLPLVGADGASSWNRSNGYNLTINSITNDSIGGWNKSAQAHTTAFHPKQIYVISKNAQTGQTVRENILYPIADYKNWTQTAGTGGKENIHIHLPRVTWQEPRSR